MKKTSKSPAVDQPRNLVDGQWAEKNQSAPGFTLSADVTAENLGEWLARNGKTLSPAATADMLEQINSSREDNDLTRTDLFRRLYVEDTGHTEQDLRDYESGLAVLRSLGRDRLADGVERYVAALSNRQTEALAPATPPAHSGLFQASDPRVQAGEAVPMIVDAEDRELHLASDEVLPDAPHRIRVLANRKLTDKEAKRFAELVDYAYRVAAHVRIQSIADVTRDTPFSFIVEVGGHRFSGAWFTQNLTQYAEHGTPQRVTDREGTGTAGTRLVEGFGPALTFDLYYDRVIED